jgi:hypothetical protein
MSSMLHADASDTALCLIHPEELHYSVQAAADLAAWLGAQRRAGSLLREPRVLYVIALDATAELARELADRLWLRIQTIEPPAAVDASAFLAGVIDQLVRHHAGHAIALVAPRAAISAALTYLDAHATPAAHTLSIVRHDGGGPAIAR